MTAADRIDQRAPNLLGRCAEAVSEAVGEDPHPGTGGA
jgi:hypothetical protein